MKATPAAGKNKNIKLSIQRDFSKISDGVVKRSFDIFLSGIGLILSFPVWILSSIIIVMESGGPIFIRQKRTGKDGKTFQILKFRTMGKNTHNGPPMKKKEEYKKHVTQIGKVMRATAMDELPQLLSIFRGYMSFVGPRPFHPEVEIIGSKYSRLEEVPGFSKRISVKPGLTGIAQIFAKKGRKTEHKIKYDILYLKKQCLMLDLKLILLSFYMTLMRGWE